MKTLEEYYHLLDNKKIVEIYQNAHALQKKHIVHINSTYQGGGVAEILTSLIPLMNDVGVETGWRLLQGNPDFFAITKKFHNGLQGEKINFSPLKKKLYEAMNEKFSCFTHLKHDAVIIHDPQPLPMIRYNRKSQPWIWRCHIDLSNPNSELWNYLEKFVLKYNEIIVSNEKYKVKTLPLHQNIICPAIDPLTSKNKHLNDKDKSKYLKKFKIPMDKPLITQISRFDKWKDPEGVIEVFKLVKKEKDCRLILCGNMATDDPEGLLIYKRVMRKYKKMIEDQDLLLITLSNDILVNILQTMSKVIIQKSTKEGFGLTVTEAMWKKTPVVASNVGGIPLQINNGENGFTLDPNDFEGFADKIIYLLNNEKKAKEIGENAHLYVKEHFLITRLLNDYLKILKKNING